MMMETALVIGGLITTVAIGGPVASALARSHRFRTPPARDMSEPRERYIRKAPFETLDLGPDPVQWPSRRQWEEGGIEAPQWPSLAWDDEHFGSHWRDGRLSKVEDRGFHAMADRRFEAKTAKTARAATAAKAAHPEASTPIRAVRSETPPTRGVRRGAAPPADAPGNAAASPMVRQPPNRAEIEALIAEVGLAGTVQAIMERTGWDFGKAAQYLARARHS